MVNFFFVVLYEHIFMHWRNQQATYLYFCWLAFHFEKLAWFSFQYSSAFIYY